MKNKLLTSILAIMLVLATSVSALDMTAAPLSLTSVEDTAANDAVTLTVTGGNQTETVTCTGDHLTVTKEQVTPYDGTYKLDVAPEANYNGDTSFTCTVSYNNETKQVTVPVTVTAVNDAPSIAEITDKQAVEDGTFTYQISATDVDSTNLTYELTQKPTGMTVSATGLVSWTPDDSQLGEHTVTAKATDSLNASATEDFKVSVRPKRVCKYGSVGDLDLTVDNPDENEEFAPGEEFTVDVQVENDGSENRDVTVKAMLYDLDESEMLSSTVSDETRVRDGEEENFDMKLRVPTTDFDVNNNFVLYVTAFEDEDENCAYREVPLELTREDDAVVVTELTLTPEETPAGKKVTATISVENVGEDDQQKVYVKLRNSYLDLKQETNHFDLDDYKSDDNEYTATLTFDVPSDAEQKEYWIEAVVYFDEGRETESKVAKLVVTGTAAKAKTDLPALDATPETGVSVQAGKKVAIPVVISNPGNTKAAFTVEVSNVDGWADVLLVEQPEQLNPGESGHAYVYLDVSEDAALGVHEFGLNVRSGNELLSTKKVAVSVEGKLAEPAPAEQTSTNKLTGLFTAGSSAANTFYVAGAVALALVGLFFLKMLFKR